MTTKMMIGGITLFLGSASMTDRVAPLAVETGDAPTWILVGLTILGMLVGAGLAVLGFRDAVRDHGFQIKSLRERARLNTTDHAENERQHRAIQGVLHRLDTRTARLCDKMGVPDVPLNGSSVEIMPEMGEKD